MENSKEGFKTAYVRINDMSVKASRETREILRGKSRRRNLKFTYGESEKILLQFLQNNNSITLNQYSEIADISKSKASKTLIIMTLTDVIRIIPSEVEDLFMANLH